MELKSFEDFRLEVLKNKGRSYNHPIKNSYGVMDYFQHYRKIRPLESRWVLSLKLYELILRSIYIKMRESLILYGELEFPLLMGSIEMIQYEYDGPKIDKNGKLIVKNYVDWISTMRLWYEDPLAYEEKLVIKKADPIVYVLNYNKFNAKYVNMSAYKFKGGKYLVRELRLLAKEGKFHVPQYKKKYKS